MSICNDEFLAEFAEWKTQRPQSLQETFAINHHVGETSRQMRQQFIEALQANEPTFGVQISPEKREALADYYELLLEHNPILHLVAPCPPEEFATRHILESLTMLEHLPANARFADVGSGGGLPAIPCLIVRDDIEAVLVESKEKKSGFLQNVLANCELQKRTEVIPRQFSEVARPPVSYVSCRALDKFTQKLPQLIKWSGNCRLLLFGGPSVAEALEANRLRLGQKLMPLSEQRYLFFSS